MRLKLQDKHLYEYAIIRLVPRVEREEFINIGVLLFSKKAKYLKTLCHINEDKLILFAQNWNRDLVNAHVDSFSKICNGDTNGGPIAQLDIPERFRWLTAVRSSCIQTSRPYPGLTADLDKKLNQLFQELVL